jgi:hypothetical protein
MMNKFCAILAALLLSLPFFASAQTSATPSIQTVCDSSADDIEKTTWDAATNSILENGSGEDIYAAFASIDYSIDDENYMYAPWLLSMAKQLPVRKGAYELQLLHASQMMKLAVPVDASSKTPSFAALKNLLTQYSTQTFQYSPEVKKKVDFAISKMTPDEDTATEIKAAPTICLAYGNLDCVGAMKQSLMLMAPVQGLISYVSMLSLVKEILEEASYIQPLAKASLKMMNEIALNEAGTTTQNKVFADLQSSFEESGFSTSEATERTWKILALYSTRGDSIDGFAAEGFRIPENTPFFPPFFVFSAAMNYLDLLQKNVPGFYSYPAEVKTTCAYGKPYHFWNAAYLSRLNVNSGKDPKAAALASYLVGELYEVFSQTAGRSPTQFLSEAEFSGYNNQLRLNILFDQLGGVYGAKSTAPSTMDADQTLTDLLQASQPIGPFSDDQLSNMNEASQFANWRKLISPDTGFFDLWKN